MKYTPPMDQTRGSQLTLGLAADRLARDERRRAMLHRLAWATHMEALGGTACVISGCVAGLAILFFILLPPVVWNGQEVGGVLVYWLWLCYLITPPAAALLVTAGRIWRRWLIRCSRCRAISLPEAVSNGPYTPLLPEMVQLISHAELIRTERLPYSPELLQGLIHSAYRDERNARNICILIGYATLATWPLGYALFQAVFGHRVIDTACLEIYLALPVLAAGNALSAVFAMAAGSSRKLLLRKARGQGLALSDPAAHSCRALAAVGQSEGQS